jgi:hypothetical protein
LAIGDKIYFITNNTVGCGNPAEMDDGLIFEPGPKN